MKIPRPTRRWFQFSLRALLVFVTLCALACSWLAVKLREMKREEAAAAVFEELGGTVEWDESAPGPAWLRGVLGEHFFAHVVFVGLPGDQGTDSTLENLGAMKRLQRLILSETHVTDGSLDHLQGLRELKELELYQRNVTDAGLEKIAGLKQLERLDLHETQVTDAGLRKLAGLNKLQSLLLADVNVTDAGLEHLQRMKQLTEVDLFGTRVTAAGVKKLQQALPNCKTEVRP